MADRLFHLTLISAKGLKDVNLVTKMAAYASASLSNDPNSKQKTSVDKDGGKSPTWNFHMTFCIPTANPLVLHIQLKSKRTFGVSKVGEVHIPIFIRELLLEGTEKFVRCDVINPSGEPEGILNISYQIGDEVAPPQPPVTASPAVVAESNAYPPPLPAYVCGVPPPQPQHGYPPAHGYPPQPQHGYPPEHGYPPQPQHGYPPQAAKPKKNRFWMGLRAGLLAADLSSDSGFDGVFDI